MRTTVKKLKSFIELVSLKGKTPEGKDVSLCDAFILQVRNGLAQASIMDKTRICFISAKMECESLGEEEFPIEVLDFLEKLDRFNGEDIIEIKKEGKTTTVTRIKPSKKFIINDPTYEISIKTLTEKEFKIEPTGGTFYKVLVLEKPLDTYIKTTAEAMLEALEDAEPYYKKVPELIYPLTIKGNTLSIKIGNNTVGSVESEISVNAIAGIEQKVEFGYGLHNIFNNLSGPVDIFIGNSYMAVLWESGIYKAQYILRGL